ncbi:MAG: thioredoxin family protein [Akkermansiaceae bacterium]|nr:thioredoxin family protein [Akkermansiaceae bacterium]
MDWKLPVVAIGSVIAGLSMVSCSLLGGGNKASKDDPYGLGAYQSAGGRVAGMGPATAGVSPGGGASAGAASGSPGKAAGITRDEDIVWAPENPDEAIGGGLEELWKQPENKTWHMSYKEAAQQSRQTGKPLLIWFTDSAQSPLCRRLSDELFSTSDFESWATSTLVRLRVDTTIPPKERNTDLGVRKSRYVEQLKKRYSVHGHPTVVLLLPSGEVHASYRGYKKGDSDYYWARLKQAVVKAEESYGKWREKYEQRGYRLWTSRDGQKTFAKLYRFQPGSVTLIDPDGKRGTTSFKRLSDADQAWILLQKKKYDARKGE